MHWFLFHFDNLGQGPDAFFYVGKHGTSVSSANSQGFQVPYGSGGPLGIFSGTTVTLKLPQFLASDEIGWISVWCRQYSVDFGSLAFPKAQRIILLLSYAFKGKNSQISSKCSRILRKSGQIKSINGQISIENCRISSKNWRIPSK